MKRSDIYKTKHIKALAKYKQKVYENQMLILLIATPQSPHQAYVKQ